MPIRHPMRSIVDPCRPGGAEKARNSPVDSRCPLWSLLVPQIAAETARVIPTTAPLIRQQVWGAAGDDGIETLIWPRCTHLSARRQVAPAAVLPHPRKSARPLGRVLLRLTMHLSHRPPPPPPLRKRLTTHVTHLLPCRSSTSVTAPPRIWTSLHR